MVSWSTGPKLSAGCGGLTGITPLVRYRAWIVDTARALGSPLAAVTTTFYSVALSLSRTGPCSGRSSTANRQTNEIERHAAAAMKTQ